MVPDLVQFSSQKQMAAVRMALAVARLLVLRVRDSQEQRECEGEACVCILGLESLIWLRLGEFRG